jgi:ribosomal-protein-alanine N-acetyltransferase
MAEIKLIPLDAERLAAIPDEWIDERTRSFLLSRLGDEWGPHAIVLAETMVGHAGFHGPPGANGIGRREVLEIGYTVFPPFRGRGHATAAVRLLIAYARERGVDELLASVRADNAASLGVLRRAGFVETGLRNPEDELVFELPTL